MPPPSTPLMRQYTSIKQQVPNTLLFFRLGDFYELFFEDAVTAARELEITLTSRNKERGEPIPMCGVPYHAAEGYLARLIQNSLVGTVRRSPMLIPVTTDCCQPVCRNVCR